jgi:hypothetical protein
MTRFEELTAIDLAGCTPESVVLILSRDSREVLMQEQPDRQYYLDWLRAGAMFLLVFFHTGRLFDAEPWHIYTLSVRHQSAPARRRALFAGNECFC